MFHREEKTNEWTTALSNYEPKPNSSFEEIATEEMKFFKSNIKDFDSMSSSLGISSLHEIINQIAEGATRESWAKKQGEKEQKELVKFKAELVALGQELKTNQIATAVVNDLVKNDINLEQTIQAAWDKCGFILQDANLWNVEPMIDIEKFLRNFELLFVEKTNKIFATHALKLHRFNNFLETFLKNFSTILKERTPIFMIKWQQIYVKINLDYATLATYIPAEWLRGIKCCFNQTVLMYLQESQNGPVPPSLVTQLSSLMQGLSCEESEATIAIRTALKLKIKTIEEILALLAPKDTI